MRLVRIYSVGLCFLFCLNCKFIEIGTVGTRSFEQWYFEILDRSKAILGPVFLPITSMYFLPRWYEIRSFAKTAGSKGFSSPEGMNAMLIWPGRSKSYISHLYKSSPTFVLISFVDILRRAARCEKVLFLIITLYLAIWRVRRS